MPSAAFGFGENRSELFWSWSIELLREVRGLCESFCAECCKGTSLALSNCCNIIPRSLATLSKVVDLDTGVRAPVINSGQKYRTHTDKVDITEALKQANKSQQLPQGKIFDMQ